MDQEASNSTRYAMEAQLQWLIKVVTESSDTAAKEIWKYAQEGFDEVRTKLDSIYKVVSQRGPESATVQDYASIRTEP